MAQTMAEYLMEQGQKLGEERGEKRGQTQAKREAVLKLLRLRFDSVPRIGYPQDWFNAKSISPRCAL